MKNVLIVLFCIMILPIVIQARPNNVENLDQTKTYKGKIVLKNGEIIRSNQIAFDNGNIKLNSNIVNIYLKEDIDFIRIKKGNYAIEGLLLGGLVGVLLTFENTYYYAPAGAVIVSSAAIFGGIGLVAGLCTKREKTYIFNASDLSFSFVNKSINPLENINTISINYSVSF
jgi:hypothetical protein